jgi:hypothetical protein
MDNTILIYGILFCVPVPLLFGIAYVIHAKTKLKQANGKDKNVRQKAREEKMKELFGYEPQEKSANKDARD